MSKRKKQYVKIDEKIENIFAKFEKTNDLEKCLNALSFMTKFEYILFNNIISFPYLLEFKEIFIKRDLF